MRVQPELVSDTQKIIKVDSVDRHMIIEPNLVTDHGDRGIDADFSHERGVLVAVDAPLSPASRDKLDSDKLAQTSPRTRVRRDSPVRVESRSSPPCSNRHHPLAFPPHHA